jgi:citrate lyase beta subunit
MAAMSSTVSIDRPEVAIRSLLFAQGSDANELPKSVLRGADAVVFGLEDTVAESAKDEALDAVGVAGALAAPASVLVRVNGVSTLRSGYDLTAAVRPAVTGVVGPKIDIDAPVRVDLEQSGTVDCLTPRVPPRIVTAATERVTRAS